ncbi:hypothetical protein GCM10012287_07170 [Streptomyces daqingensis]|uniref:Uncharacterized protein n=1 Tax=Streptomyces daqingensis TaxID=1472640 RepID=A0ABQ2LV45_9ACTN|nr:hypothetical protein GCM10012287_07170 [Streptomyces daqingensis]
MPPGGGGTGPSRPRTLSLSARLLLSLLTLFMMPPASFGRAAGGAAAGPRAGASRPPNAAFRGRGGTRGMPGFWHTALHSGHTEPSLALP